MRVVILGAGGHGRVVAECARLSPGVEAIGFLDDDVAKHGLEPLGLQVLGAIRRAERLDPAWDAAVLGLGDNRGRLALAQRLGAAGVPVQALTHPRAVLSPSATVGAGTVLMAGSVLQTGASTGMAVIINTGATVDHDCRLADGVHVAPGAHLAGDVSVGARTLIGIGATIIEGIRIGADCLIAAGAVVVADVADGCRVAGVPARPLSSGIRT